MLELARKLQEDDSVVGVSGQPIWPFSEALGTDVCKLWVLDVEKGILFQKFPCTVGDPPLEVLDNQPDNVANEGVVYLVVIPFKVSILELQISIIGFETSPLLLIGCHKQPTILSSIRQGIDKIGSHIKFRALFYVHKLLMDAVAYDSSLVERSLCCDVLVSMQDLLNEVFHPFLKVGGRRKAHNLAQHGHQIVVILVEITAEEFLRKFHSAAPSFLEAM